MSDHRVLPVIAPQTALNVGNRLRSWLASAGISAPRADELEGVGHFPQVEAPTKVVDVIEDFIATKCQMIGSEQQSAQQTP